MAAFGGLSSSFTSQRGSMEIEASQRQARSRAQALLGEQLAAVFFELALPAVTVTIDDTHPGRSRLGGDAILPAGADWPLLGDEPLAVIAVYDLAELTHLDSGLALPSDGFLTFFHDGPDSHHWGHHPADRDAWRVIHTPYADAEQRHAPDNGYDFDAHPVRFTQTITFPYGDEPALAPINAVAPDELHTLGQQLDEIGLGGFHHRIGGWPSPEQAAIRYDCHDAFTAAGLTIDLPDQPPTPSNLEHWRLLAQFQSDDTMGWSWGAGGTLYYALPDPAAAHHNRFDLTWAILQTS